MSLVHLAIGAYESDSSSASSEEDDKEGNKQNSPKETKKRTATNPYRSLPVPEGVEEPIQKAFNSGSKEMTDNGEPLDEGAPTESDDAATGRPGTSDTQSHQPPAALSKSSNSGPSASTSGVKPTHSRRSRSSSSDSRSTSDSDTEHSKGHRRGDSNNRKRFRSRSRSRTSRSISLDKRLCAD